MKAMLLDRYGLELNDGELKGHVKNYLASFQCDDIFDHTLEVVGEVKRLHQQFDFDLDKCIVGAYLHDLGRVVKKDDLVQFCQSFGYAVSKGESEVPGLLHQVASKIIAIEIFGVQDNEVLEAVACHTTLKMHPNTTEMVVFLADKLSWKDPIYDRLKRDMKNGLDQSMERGVYEYFHVLHKQRDTLKYYHKLSQEAYGYFKGILGDQEE